MLPCTPSCFCGQERQIHEFGERILGKIRGCDEQEHQGASRNCCPADLDVLCRLPAIHLRWGGEPQGLTDGRVQAGPVVAPRPAIRQFRTDEFRPVLLFMLIEKHEVIDTPINGATAEIVASSWIDPLAGLSR